MTPDPFDFYLVIQTHPCRDVTWIENGESVMDCLFDWNTGKRLKDIDASPIDEKDLPKFAYEIWHHYIQGDQIPSPDKRAPFTAWCGPHGPEIAKAIQWEE